MQDVRDGKESTMVLGNLPLLADLMDDGSIHPVPCVQWMFGILLGGSNARAGFLGFISIDSLLIGLCRQIAVKYRMRRQDAVRLSKAIQKVFHHLTFFRNIFETSYITSAPATAAYFWGSSILIVSSTAWPDWRKKKYYFCLENGIFLDLADLVYRFEIADLTRRFNHTQYYGTYVKCHVY